MALILSFDTTTKVCAVAVGDGDRLLAQRTDSSDRLNHAEVLNRFVAEALEEAGVQLRSLSAVAVGVGPGSYTGSRIGLSAAKGFCFALDIPLIGMGTPHVLVHALRASGFTPRAHDLLHPMIDARRMEVFTTTCAANGEVLQAAHPLVLDGAWHASWPVDASHVVFGDGADKATEVFASDAAVLHVAGIHPGPEGLVACAHEHFLRGLFADLAYLVPDYGKAANVAQPKARGLQ